MHIRSYFELLSLDTEIERPLRSFRKTKRVEEVIMAGNRIHRNENKEHWLKFGSRLLMITT